MKAFSSNIWPLLYIFPTYRHETIEKYVSILKWQRKNNYKRPTKVGLSVTEHSKLRTCLSKGTQTAVIRIQPHVLEMSPQECQSYQFSKEIWKFGVFCKNIRPFSIVSGTKKKETNNKIKQTSVQIKQSVSVFSMWLAWQWIATSALLLDLGWQHQFSSFSY